MSQKHHCNAGLKGNRTALFQNLAENKTSLQYSYDYTKTGGDPAGGCAKTLDITYNCVGNPTSSTYTVPAEAGYNGSVNLQCPVPPPPPPPPPPPTRSLCTAPNADVPEQVSGWNYKGCYRDCQGRSLPHRLANVGSIEQCIAQAKAAGFNTAGNQFFGECWAGNNRDWNRQGNAGCCEPLGGFCTQQIYSSQ